MGRIIVSEFTSLDGVFEDPHLWHFPFFNKQAQQYKLDELRSADALLLGRTTYDGFADAWPKRSGYEFADTYNSMPKHVVSNTLENPVWNNTHVVRSGLRDELGRLKELYEKDIYIHGSGALANSLMREGLVDEVRLMVHPVVVGKGRRFFENGVSVPALKLANVTTYDSGIILLTYQPTEQSTEA